MGGELGHTAAVAQLRIVILCWGLYSGRQVVKQEREVKGVFWVLWRWYDIIWILCLTHGACGSGAGLGLVY